MSKPGLFNWQPLGPHVALERLTFSPWVPSLSIHHHSPAATTKLLFKLPLPLPVSSACPLPWMWGGTTHGGWWRLRSGSLGRPGEIMQMGKGGVCSAVWRHRYMQERCVYCVAQFDGGVHMALCAACAHETQGDMWHVWHWTALT